MVQKNNIGDSVAPFELNNQYGNVVKLSDFANKKLIIFFYPKAMTPACTNEVCNLNDGYALLKEKGYELLGISADSIEKLLKFSQKYNFSFPLLSDTSLKVLQSFGVWGEKKFMGKVYDGIHRKTFIIDNQHKIQFIIEKVDTKNHTQQILSIIDKF